MWIKHMVVYLHINHIEKTRSICLSVKVPQAELPSISERNTRLCNLKIPQCFANRRWWAVKKMFYLHPWIVQVQQSNSFLHQVFGLVWLKMFPFVLLSAFSVRITLGCLMLENQREGHHRMCGHFRKTRKCHYSENEPTFAIHRNALLHTKAFKNARMLTVWQSFNKSLQLSMDGEEGGKIILQSSRNPS